jgi:hypothetical protein
MLRHVRERLLGDEIGGDLDDLGKALEQID